MPTSTLYADVPGLFPVREPSRRTTTTSAPILWSPRRRASPPWWGEIPDDPTTIYATLGQLRPARTAGGSVCEALADLPVTVLAATAGKGDGAKVPGNVRVAPYLPG